MPSVFSYEWDTPRYKGKTLFNTGIFIGGQFFDGSSRTTIDYWESYYLCSEATPQDVDLAVDAAQTAFDTVWDAMETHKEELAALESLDNGKTFDVALTIDIQMAIEVIRYYAGWADKLTGQTIETNPAYFTYTIHEPYGVVGQIISCETFPPHHVELESWPCPRYGQHHSPETVRIDTIRLCTIMKEVGIPDGVFNLVTGYGNTVGEAISTHMKIEKLAFTGSTLTGRKIMEAAAKSNLKDITLELGGKSSLTMPTSTKLLNGMASSSIMVNVHCLLPDFVQSGVYDEVLERLTARAKGIKLGDPFTPGTLQGPQISQPQCDRIMGYVQSGKDDGATCHLGGDRFGTEGFYINPTIFTNVKPDMKIVKEEIFGPVAVVIKFETKDEVIKQANDSTYGLAAAIFTPNLNRAILSTRKLQAGTVWVNCANIPHTQVPFGGYKQSGIGRENGKYALAKWMFQVSLKRWIN